MVEWANYRLYYQLEATERCFLERFFPPSKRVHLRYKIRNFGQLPTESLHETWERLKKNLMKCPNN